MVFQAFLQVFITTQQNVSLITPYSVVFLIYNAIYSVLGGILAALLDSLDGRIVIGIAR